MSQEPPARTGGNRASRIMLVAGLLLLVVALGLAAYAISLAPGGSPSSSLAAGTSPTGSALPSAGRSASPASPDPGVRALAAFRKLVVDRNLSYHISSTGQVQGPGFKQRYRQSLDVSADNYRGTINTIGGSGKASIVRFAGVVYIKQAGGSWIRRRTSESYVRMWPFLYLRPFDVTPVKATTLNGAKAYLLRTTPTYRPNTARMIDVASLLVSPDREWLDVYVAASGRPLRAVYHLEAGGKDAAGRPLIVGSSTHTISKVAAKFAISAPRR